jgi:hypothetical protein
LSGRLIENKFWRDVCAFFLRVLFSPPIFFFFFLTFCYFFDDNFVIDPEGFVLKEDFEATYIQHYKKAAILLNIKDEFQKISFTIMQMEHQIVLQVTQESQKI